VISKKKNNKRFLNIKMTKKSFIISEKIFFNFIQIKKKNMYNLKLLI